VNQEQKWKVILKKEVLDERKRRQEGISGKTFRLQVTCSTSSSRNTFQEKKFNSNFS
jgi:hypothetical protein